MNAYKKLLNWAKKQLENEKDKWESGMPNSYFEWEDLYDDLEERYGKNA